jgi:hypothetical protein
MREIALIVASLLTRSCDPSLLLRYPSVYSCCLATKEARRCATRLGENTVLSTVAQSQERVSMLQFLHGINTPQYFQKHGENVNSASYCEVLSKLWDGIHRKYPGQLARGIMLHHDNDRPHTA